MDDATRGVAAETPLDRIHRLCRWIAAATAVWTAVIAGVDHGGVPATIVMAIAVVVLTARLVGVTGERCGDVVDVGAISVITAVGDFDTALVLVFLLLQLRAFRLHRASVCFVTAGFLAGAVLHAGPVHNFGTFLTPTLVAVLGLAGVFIPVLAGALRREERTRTAEQIMGDAGSALVAAETRAAVIDVALRAGAALAGDGAWAALVDTDGTDFEIVGTAGPGAPAVAGVRLPMSRLPKDVVEEVGSGRVFHRATPTSLPVWRPAGIDHPLASVTVPISLDPHRSTVLSVYSARVLSNDVRDAIVKLAVPLALALERVTSGERFRALVMDSSELVAILGKDLDIRFVSPAAHTILGVEPADLVGGTFHRFVDPDDLPRVMELAAEVLASPRATARFETRVRHADGRWRHVDVHARNLVDDPAVQGIVLSARDVTERAHMQAEVERRAFHDPLTGLPNRLLFSDRLDHALITAARRGTDVAVLFLDLDDFKDVNDGQGHAMGDQLLRAVAYNLAAACRVGDTVARLGGDEFAILLEDAGDVAGAMEVAARIQARLAQRVTVDGVEVCASASIGVAMAEPGATADALVGQADLAMYAAKRAGKGRAALYDPVMLRDTIDQLELRSDLAHAVERDELFLQYQPVVELAGERIVGVEALLRWRHPTRGVVAPLDFIPAAEATGLIVAIGEWVLKTACAHARGWQLAHPDFADLRLSVNLSPRQLVDADVVDHVRFALAESGLPPSSLVLEITESVLMTDTTGSAALLGRVRDLGVSIAVDDFGTGYSSLSYLRTFPLDGLKIDKSFVCDITEEHEQAALMAAILGLADGLNLWTVAEGIEEPYQAEWLRSLGCTYGQGFLFSRPLDVVDVDELLAAADRQPALPVGGCLSVLI